MSALINSPSWQTAANLKTLHNDFSESAPLQGEALVRHVKDLVAETSQQMQNMIADLTAGRKKLAAAMSLLPKTFDASQLDGDDEEDSDF